MVTSYVLDASAVALRFLDQPGAGSFRDWFAQRLLDRDRLLAPGILPYELAHVLHRERGGTDAVLDPEFCLATLRTAMHGVTLDHDAWARTWPWADRLSAYDAAYLGLAVAKDATLVTYDKKLAEVGKGEVSVVGLGGFD